VHGRQDNRGIAAADSGAIALAARARGALPSPRAMAFSNPRDALTSYLILRDLHDGNVIDWPLDEGHLLRPLFDKLTEQGYVARWDRMWPLHDRYRLTEKGIATLEAAYRPAGAPQFVEQIRAQRLPAPQRRAALQAQRLDPVLWPILHDPYTHWSTILQDQGPYYRFFWEDQAPRRRPAPPKPAKPAAPKAQVRVGGGGRGMRAVLPHTHVVVHEHHFHQDPSTLVDLDRETDDPDYVAPEPGDYDVS
jgi:hypothetical protein